jgi:hypothetical protein
MNATILARTPTSFTLQIEVPYDGSRLDFEETLQHRLNEAGGVATAEGLKRFDTDGAPITVGSSKLTTKGPVEKDYQTPYGVATVARHVYQGPQGGPTYCPLDRDARIVVTSTPRFAKILSPKYAEFSSPRVQPGPPPHPRGRAGGGVPPDETRSGRGRMGVEAVAKAGPRAPLGQGPRGCPAGDHVLHEPERGRADG